MQVSLCCRAICCAIGGSHHSSYVPVIGKHVFVFTYDTPIRFITVPPAGLRGNVVQAHRLGTVACVRTASRNGPGSWITSLAISEFVLRFATPRHLYRERVCPSEVWKDLVS